MGGIAFLFTTGDNKSLDASGGGVFLNLLDAAKGALIRAAASTQPFGDLQMNSFRANLLLVFLFLAAGSSFAQTHFLFEEPEPFKHPVQLPSGAAELLRREMEGTRGCVNQSADIVQSLKAARIDLGGNRVAFIARSAEDCLNGPDNDWFWIVLQTPHGYKLLLRGGTIAVTVRTERTRGFPDIETNAASPEGVYREVYKFDGSVYEAYLCTHTGFSTLKPERVTCRTH